MGEVHDMTKKAVESTCSNLMTEIESINDELEQLREDCKEAMQREVRSRIDRDNALQEGIEHEAAVRAEETQALEDEIHDVRKGLETHTHELSLDGLPSPAANVNLGTSANKTSGMGPEAASPYL